MSNLIINNNNNIIVFMQDNILDNLKNAIKFKTPSLFIKILVDFYDELNKENENIEMPTEILLKSCLRFHIKNTTHEDGCILLSSNKELIYLNVEDYESPYYMESFIRNYSKGHYLYKDRIFELKNYASWTYDADGYYNYIPYLDKIVSLNYIEKIGAEDEM